MRLFYQVWGDAGQYWQRATEAEAESLATELCATHSQVCITTVDSDGVTIDVKWVKE